MKIKRIAGFVGLLGLLAVVAWVIAAETQSTTLSQRITSRRYDFPDVKAAIEQRLYQSKGTDIASAATITLAPNEGNVFKITGTARITSITAESAGFVVYLISASTDTLVDGGNLKLAGNRNGTADDITILVCDGTNWHQAAPVSVN